MNVISAQMPTSRSTAPELPRRIVKRDGRDEPFEAARIASALTRAGAASGEYDAD